MSYFKDSLMRFAALLLFLCLCSIIFAGEDEKRVKTHYDIFGNPVNQSIDSKGWHTVVGVVKLVAGQSTVTLNTSTSEGRQDISFIADSTYRGMAWSLDVTNIRSYRVYPTSGKQFIIKSDSTGDTSTVRFRVEGE